MSKTIIGTNTSIITEIQNSVTEPGDYFVFIPKVGLIRARKTSQVSWQYYGIGIKRIDLTTMVADYAPAGQLNLPLIKGDYNLELLQSYLEKPETETETGPEETGSEETGPEETKSKGKGKKGKGKKKGKEEEVEPKDNFKVKKKQLEALFTHKEIKAALKNAGVDKKAWKATLNDIPADGDGNSIGQDIITSLDLQYDEIAPPEIVNAVFASLK